MRTTTLFTSAGRRNQLIQCFRDDAVAMGISLRVLAADMNPALSPACQQADAAFGVPACSDAGYVDALLSLCREHGVSLLIPTIDPELAVLSRRAADFAAVGTRVVVSSPDVVALAGDKQATAVRLAAAGISTPRTLSLADYRTDPQSLKAPLIAKPVGGSASAGIVRPRTMDDLAQLPAAGYIVQELWEGAEYTVNVFFDQAGELRCTVPHRRLEVRAGEVSKGRTEYLPQLTGAARRLATILPGARGPLCFQAVVREDGDYAVFEINARFGGGYPLAHHAGARFSGWLLEEACSLPSTANDAWKQGVTMLRYDAAVFLDA
jgi:carbamoyl-phosphate synthase large subunit